MEFEGKKEALLFISEWEGKLSSQYRQAWELYKKDRDIVAAKLYFREKEMLFITVFALSNVVIMDLKSRYLISGDKEKVVNTRGNTKALELASKMATISKEYEKKCASFMEQYSNEMKKLKNNRR